MSDNRAADAAHSDLFLAIWPLVSEGAHVTVKIGVLVKEGRTKPRLARRASAPACDLEELWLGEIAETQGYFSGVVRMPPQRLSRVERGQSIRFDARHILGWTLAVNANSPRSAATAPEREFLADLETS